MVFDLQEQLQIAQEYATNYVPYLSGGQFIQTMIYQNEDQEQSQEESQNDYQEPKVYFEENISDNQIHEHDQAATTHSVAPERVMQVWSRFFENAAKRSIISTDSAKPSKPPVINKDVDHAQDAVKETESISNGIKSGELVSLLINACHKKEIARAKKILKQCNSIEEDWVKIFCTVNIRYGTTPIHAACRSNDLEVLKNVFEMAGGVVEVVDSVFDQQNQTPLIVACQCGFLAAVEYILESAADVNAQDVHGRTALHSAAVGGYTDCVELLLEYGSDPRYFN